MEEKASDFDFSKHPKATGQLYVTQHFVEMYIDDKKNVPHLRKYAMKIHAWLGGLDMTIEKIFDTSYHYGVFILQTMERYWNCRSQTVVYEDVENTWRALQMGMEACEDRIKERPMASITDVGYRGYD